MTEKEFRTGKKAKSGMIALKDFVICANDDFFEIKKGDDIEALNIPKKYYDNLKTEQVIKDK